MRVEVKYLRFEIKNGQLMPARNYYYEIVEIDETSVVNPEELAGDALSEKLHISKDRFKVIESRPI
jgi:tRNA A22 N-methylase